MKEGPPRSNAEIADGPNIMAAKWSHQKHLCRPTTNPSNAREGSDDRLVVTTTQMGQVKRSARHMHSEVFEGCRFGSGHAARPKDGFLNA
jgi:hypothetical protein